MADTICLTRTALFRLQEPNHEFTPEESSVTHMLIELQQEQSTGTRHPELKTRQDNRTGRIKHHIEVTTEMQGGMLPPRDLETFDRFAYSRINTDHPK